MMSSTNEEDPFLQVQQDVLSQLSSTRQLFTSYLRILSLTTTSHGTSPTPELKSALSDLESSLASLSEDVTDLSDAVAAAESSPDRFGLSQAEVDRRRRTVQEVRGEIDDMKEEILKGGARKDASRGKAPAADDTILPDPNKFGLGDEGEGEEGEDHYAEFEQRQQMHMLREQDTHLDGVFQTVGNLRRQADDMGRELEEQSHMLDVVDEMADRVGGRLQTGMQKLQFIMRRNEDTLSSCCIAVLIFALILLLVLLVVL